MVVGDPRFGVCLLTLHPCLLPPSAPQVLLDCMRAIAAEQGGKSLGQVAINWTLCKGALPIPGAKNAKQACAGAGWAAFGGCCWGRLRCLLFPRSLRQTCSACGQQLLCLRGK